MTDRDMPSGDVERVAAALEEAWKAANVDSTDQRWSLVWAPHLIRALSAMPDRQAGINEGLEMAAKVAEQMGADRIERNPDGSLRSYDMNCKHERGSAVLNAMRVRAQTIANAIRAMKVEK